MQEFRMGQQAEERLVKVYLNKHDDFIMMNQDDTALIDRFISVIKWLDDKQIENKKTSAEMQKKYKGREIIETNGDDIKIDTEQAIEYVKLQVSMCKDCHAKIDEIFGQDTVKKYFRETYDAIPDFAPNEDCFYDFFEEISPVMEEVFKRRVARNRTKYNKGRKGKHSKTKDELIADAKDRLKVVDKSE